MNVYSISTGFFKLDGGAMFGVVPKSIWNKINPADSNNMCTWAMRCLLIEDGKKLILIDNGMGNKQNEKFFSHYFPFGEDTLDKSLRSKGFSRDDITDVFLTHLHFDHCGGSINWNSTRNGYEPAFKNAVYWSNENHWKWALEPNHRERASFLKENFLPIQENGQLRFCNFPEAPVPRYPSEIVQGVKDFNMLWDRFGVGFVNGHTEKMMIPHIFYKGKTIIYAADLIPSAGHLPIPFVMGYDLRPLETLEEKKYLLGNAVKENAILFFEHDPLIECCNLQNTDKGIRMKESFKLEDL